MRLLLENFDGPLGLLLYLIKTQEINIFNIPIVLVTEQYMSFLHQTRDLDYDQAGEYLAIAAQLIEIKAQWLIPTLQNRVTDEASSLEEVAEDDPRRPLVEKLLEYEAIKAACEQLESLPMLGRDTFASGECKRRQAEFEALPAPIKGDAFALAIALERALLRFAEHRAAPKVKVRAQKVTIHQKMLILKERFSRIPECTLRELFEDCETRYELIVTLNAVLELVKAHQVDIFQQELFGPIQLTRGAAFAEEAPDIDDDGRPREKSKPETALEDSQPEAGI